MGVKERKERDRQEMRELIIQTAHRLFLDHGFEGVSIRNLADVIEYSPAVIYLYFKDKRELFYTIQGEAFKAFNEFVVDGKTIDKPFDRLIDLSQKYMAFALQYPKYYDLMFVAESPPIIENSEDWLLKR